MFVANTFKLQNGPPEPISTLHHCTSKRTKLERKKPTRPLHADPSSQDPCGDLLSEIPALGIFMPIHADRQLSLVKKRVVENAQHFSHHLDRCPVPHAAPSGSPRVSEHVVEKVFFKDRLQEVGPHYELTLQLRQQQQSIYKSLVNRSLSFDMLHACTTSICKNYYAQ